MSNTENAQWDRRWSRAWHVGISPQGTIPMVGSFHWLAKHVSEGHCWSGSGSGVMWGPDVEAPAEAQAWFAAIPSAHPTLLAALPSGGLAGTRAFWLVAEAGMPSVYLQSAPDLSGAKFGMNE